MELTPQELQKIEEIAESKGMSTEDFLYQEKNKLYKRIASEYSEG